MFSTCLNICRQCEHLKDISELREEMDCTLKYWSCQMKFEELMMLSYVDFKPEKITPKHTIATEDVITNTITPSNEFEIPFECPFKLEHLVWKQP